MIAVILERFDKSLYECFGVKKTADLPFLNAFLREVLVENCLADSKIITVKIPLKNSAADLRKLKILLNKKPSERVLLTYSDLCFSGDIYSEILHGNDSDFIVKNDENYDLFCVIKGKILLEILEKNNDDFACVFKSVTEQKRCKGYAKIIANPLKYKGFCIDALCGRVLCRLPEIAQGIYASSVIPKGDFVIIPPVLFGDDVQIERGCVIGPNVIISDGVLVAENSCISNCLIGENSYVSSGCRVEGSVASSNVVLRRNSTLLSNSVLCHDVIVSEDSVVESNSFIRAFSRVDGYSDFLTNYREDSSNTPDGFYGYTPEQAARLGAATGICFDMPKIGVASDGELNSSALKLSFLGGAITTGARCYDFGNSFYSSLHYFLDFCQLDCAVFFSGNDNGTLISLFRKGESRLSKSDFYNIKSLLSTSEILRCSKDECKNIRQIHGMQRMYVQNIASMFDNKFDFCPIFKSDNMLIRSTGEIIASKIGFNKEGQRVEFNVNSTATRLSVNCDNIAYPNSKLIEIASFYQSKYDGLFKDYFKYDCLMLSFCIMKIMSIENKGLAEITEDLPRFYVAEKSIDNSCGLRVLAADLSRDNKIDLRRDSIFYSDGLSSVKINKLDKGGLCVRAKALSMETASELVENLTRFIIQREGLNY